jgi:hypothetical protein
MGQYGSEYPILDLRITDTHSKTILAQDEAAETLHGLNGVAIVVIARPSLEKRTSSVVHGWHYTSGPSKVLRLSTSPKLDAPVAMMDSGFSLLHVEVADGSGVHGDSGLASHSVEVDEEVEKGQYGSKSATIPLLAPICPIMAYSGPFRLRYHLPAGATGKRQIRRVESGVLRERFEKAGNLTIWPPSLITSSPRRKRRRRRR